MLLAWPKRIFGLPIQSSVCRRVSLVEIYCILSQLLKNCILAHRMYVSGFQRFCVQELFQIWKSKFTKGPQISKAIVLETPLTPKQRKYVFAKILHYEARAEFCQIFRLFWGAMAFQEKNAFEIYWPLPDSFINLKSSIV